MIARYVPRQVERLDGFVLAVVIGGGLVAAACFAAVFFVTRQPLWISAAGLVPAMIGVVVSFCHPSSRPAGEPRAMRDARAQGEALARRIDSLDRPLPPTPDKTSEE